MRFYIRFAIFISIVSACISCSGRRNEADRRDSIPQRKMIDIITDLYITDGLMVMPIVHHWYDSKDSVSAYIDVIKSHGYTKEEFDRTLRFYFIKKPRALMRIYEQALARLSEMETRFDQEATRIQSRISNYWTGKEVYTESDSTEFSIRFDFWNIYNLSFTATVHPADQTFNPGPLLYTSHPDSILTGRRYYIPTMEYIRDGYPHRYVYRINDPDRTRLQLSGDLFCSGGDPSAEKHFIIEDISVTY